MTYKPDQKWVKVALAGLIVYAIVAIFVSCVGPDDPEFDPHPVYTLPPTSPHHSHAGGPGCGGWSVPVLPHEAFEPRPLSIGHPGLPGTGGSLRVLTLNAHHFEAQGGGSNLARLAALLASECPDVVILQEVDLGTSRPGGANGGATLAKLLGMHHVYSPTMDWGGGSYGAAILSRWPIIASESHRLPFLPSLEPRQVLATRIRPPAGTGLPEFLAMGVHLDHISPDMRLAQAQEVERLARGASLPVLLAGDFNARRGEPTISRLLDTWGDATAAKATIDFILTRGGWAPVASWTVEDPSLDHPIVVSILDWVPPKDVSK